MIRRILRTGLIVTVETVLLILLAATWGVPGARRPAASARVDEAPSFEQSIRREVQLPSPEFGSDR